MTVLKIPIVALQFTLIRLSLSSSFLLIVRLSLPVIRILALSEMKGPH